MMDYITSLRQQWQWRWFVLSAFKISVPTPDGQVPKWAFLWLTRNAYLCLWHVRTSSLLPSKCFLSHGCMTLTICIECTIHISGRGCWAVFMPPLWKDKYNSTKITTNTEATMLSKAYCNSVNLLCLLKGGDWLAHVNLSPPSPEWWK